VVEENPVKSRIVIGVGIVLGLVLAFLQGLVLGHRASYSAAYVRPMSGSSETDAMPGFAEVDLESYDVLEWSEARVLLSKTVGCVEYLYTFDRLTRSATGLRKPLANRSGCAGVEQKELRLTLRASSEFSDKVRAETR
jgi:hypothetical protein